MIRIMKDDMWLICVLLFLSQFIASIFNLGNGDVCVYILNFLQ
jgi:hypothetical protein